MKVVSPLLKNFVYPALYHTGQMRHMAPPYGCAILSYHGVLPEDYSSDDPFLESNLLPVSAFREQLRFLKANYEVISPDDFRNWIHNAISLPPRAVLITCDDGLQNNVTHMLPVLKEEAVRCLFFITGASLSDTAGIHWYEELYHLLRFTGSSTAGKFFPGDTEPVQKGNFPARWWKTVCAASRLDAKTREEKLCALRSYAVAQGFHQEQKRFRLLNPQELRCLVESGMTIGAHSMSHPVFSECSETEAYRETMESKVLLERALARSVWSFAYPFGNYETMGEREIKLAQEAGFECAFMNITGGFADGSNLFAFPRTHITVDMHLAELEARMTGLHAHLQRAVRGYSS